MHQWLKPLVEQEQREEEQFYEAIRRMLGPIVAHADSIAKKLVERKPKLALSA